MVLPGLAGLIDDIRHVTGSGQTTAAGSAPADEIRALVEDCQGRKRLDGVLAVVLETDGSFSVVPGSEEGTDPDPPTLEAAGRL